MPGICKELSISCLQSSPWSQRQERPPVYQGGDWGSQKVVEFVLLVVSMGRFNLTVSVPNTHSPRAGRTSEEPGVPWHGASEASGGC